MRDQGAPGMTAEPLGALQRTVPALRPSSARGFTYRGGDLVRTGGLAAIYRGRECHRASDGYGVLHRHDGRRRVEAAKEPLWNVAGRACGIEGFGKVALILPKDWDPGTISNCCGLHRTGGGHQRSRLPVPDPHRRTRTARDGFVDTSSGETNRLARKFLRRMSRSWSLQPGRGP